MTDPLPGLWGVYVGAVFWFRCRRVHGWALDGSASVPSGGAGVCMGARWSGLQASPRADMAAPRASSQTERRPSVPAAMASLEGGASRGGIGGEAWAVRDCVWGRPLMGEFADQPI